jgi:hypothetical protein
MKSTPSVVRSAPQCRDLTPLQPRRFVLTFKAQKTSSEQIDIDLRKRLQITVTSVIIVTSAGKFLT